MYYTDDTNSLFFHSQNRQLFCIIGTFTALPMTISYVVRIQHLYMPAPSYFLYTAAHLYTSYYNLVANAFKIDFLKHTRFMQL